MPLELWIAFTLASAVLLLVPGPTVMLVVSYALGRGRTSAWATVPGVTLGDFTSMTISLLGAGAILAASATLFTALKLAGAAYLVWLGLRLWRSAPALRDARPSSLDTRHMFWNSFIVTALNPKGIIFFVTFMPQFVTTEKPVLPQFAILVATFLVLTVVNVALWATLAGEIRSRFQRPAMVRLVNRVGGGFLIGAGFLAVVARRSD